MRKWLYLLPMLLLLAGCGQQEVFEQVGDVYQVLAPQPAMVSVDLPPEAAVTAMGSGQENVIYFCDGYTLSVQTMQGGDLLRTVGELTGFSPDQLTMFQTSDDAVKRYDLAWICVGENGDQVGRTVLLDDGAYHYAVTVMCPAEGAGDLQLVWDTVLDSVSLRNTGS